MSLSTTDKKFIIIYKIRNTKPFGFCDCLRDLFIDVFNQVTSSTARTNLITDITNYRRIKLSLVNILIDGLSSGDLDILYNVIKEI